MKEKNLNLPKCMTNNIDLVHNIIFMWQWSRCVFNNYSTSNSLDMRLQIPYEARSTELVIIISYLASANGIIIFVKKKSRNIARSC